MSSMTSIKGPRGAQSTASAANRPDLVQAFDFTRYQLDNHFLSPQKVSQMGPNFEKRLKNLRPGETYVVRIPLQEGQTFTWTRGLKADSLSGLDIRTQIVRQRSKSHPNFGPGYVEFNICVLRNAVPGERELQVSSLHPQMQVAVPGIFRFSVQKKT